MSIGKTAFLLLLILCLFFAVECKKKKAKEPKDMRPKSINPGLWCNSCQAIIREIINKTKYSQKESEVTAAMEDICNLKNLYVYEFPPPDMRRGCEAFLGTYDEEILKTMTRRVNDQQAEYKVCFTITNACKGLNLDKLNENGKGSMILPDGVEAPPKEAIFDSPDQKSKQAELERLLKEEKAKEKPYVGNVKKKKTDAEEEMEEEMEAAFVDYEKKKALKDSVKITAGFVDDVEKIDLLASTMVECAHLRELNLIETIVPSLKSPDTSSSFSFFPCAKRRRFKVPSNDSSSSQELINVLTSDRQLVFIYSHGWARYRMNEAQEILEEISYTASQKIIHSCLNPSGEYLLIIIENLLTNNKETRVISVNFNDSLSKSEEIYKNLNYPKNMEDVLWSSNKGILFLKKNSLELLELPDGDNEPLFKPITFQPSTKNITPERILATEDGIYIIGSSKNAKQLYKTYYYSLAKGNEGINGAFEPYKEIGVLDEVSQVEKISKNLIVFAGEKTLRVATFKDKQWEFVDETVTEKTIEENLLDVELKEKLVKILHISSKHMILVTNHFNLRICMFIKEERCLKGRISIRSLQVAKELKLIYEEEHQFSSPNFVDLFLSSYSSNTLIFTVSSLQLINRNHVSDDAPEESKEEALNIPKNKSAQSNGKKKKVDQSEIEQQIFAQKINITSLELMDPINLLSLYYEKKNNKAAESLMKRVELTKEEVNLCKWNASEKTLQDFESTLRIIKNFSILKKIPSKIIKENGRIDVALKIIDYCLEILSGKIIEKKTEPESLNELVYQYLRLQYKSRLLNMSRSMLGDVIGNMKEFEQLMNKDLVKLISEYIDLRKYNRARDIFENFTFEISSNYWRVFQESTTFIVDPDVFSPILPKNLQSEHSDFVASSSSHDELLNARLNKINAISSNFFTKIPKAYPVPRVQVIFSRLIRSFDENSINSMQVDNGVPFETLLVSCIENLQKSHKFSEKIKKYPYVSPDQPIPQLSELNSTDTYFALCDYIRRISGNIESCVKLLTVGYSQGFKKELSAILLTYSLYAIALYKNELVGLDFEEFADKMNEAERFCFICENNLKDMELNKVLSQSIRNLYNLYSNKRNFEIHLQYFCIKSEKCSVRIFLEVIKLCVRELKLEDIWEYGFVEPEYLMQLSLEYFQTRGIFEHHEHFNEVFKQVEMIRGQGEDTQRCLRLTEVSELLYKMSINKEISWLLEISAGSANSTNEKFLTLLEQFIENYILNRRKANSVAIGNISLPLDSIRSIVKVITFIRDGVRPQCLDAQIYQVLIKKLLEFSNISVLEELISRERFFTIIDKEYFESLIIDAVRNRILKSNKASQEADFINKALKLIKWTSTAKSAEKSFLKAALIVERLGINSKELSSSGNRLEILVKILNLAKDDEIKEIQFYYLYKKLMKFGGKAEKEKNFYSEEFFQFLKNLGKRLLKIGGLQEKVVDIISTMREHNSSCISELCLDLLNHSQTLTPEQRSDYLTIALLKCQNSELLPQIVKGLPLNKAGAHLPDEKVVSVNTSLIDRTVPYYNNNNLISKNLKLLYKKVRRKVLKGPEYSSFFRDLTISPKRAFFTLSEQESLRLDEFEEMILTLLKEEVFDKTKLIQGALKVLINKSYYCVLKYEEFAIEKEIDPKTFPGRGQLFSYYPREVLRCNSDEKRTISIVYDKFWSLFLVLKKMVFFKSYLKTPQDLERFLYDETFRNHKLSTIILENEGSPEILSEISLVLEANNIKPLDLLLLNLAKYSAEKKEKEVKETVQKITPLIKEQMSMNKKITEPFLYLERIYERLKDEGLEYFLYVLELFSNEFKEVSEAIDYRSCHYIASFLAVIRQQEGVKSIIPLTKFFIEDSLKGKINKLQFLNEGELTQRGESFFQQLADKINEDNVFVLAKCLPNILSDPLYEFEVFFEFLRLQFIKKSKKLIHNKAGKVEAESLEELRGRFLMRTNAALARILPQHIFELLEELDKEVLGKLSKKGQGVNFDFLKKILDSLMEEYEIRKFNLDQDFTASFEKLSSKIFNNFRSISGL